MSVKIVKLTFSFFFILFLTVINAEEKMVVRFSAPDKTLLSEFPPEKYDIAAYKPGEFLDLVVTRSEYEELVKRGFDIQITQTEDRLRKNLKMRTDRDLTGYRDYEDLEIELQQIESQYPNICKLYDIGKSWGKVYSDSGNSNYNDYSHEIWAMKVSDNVEIEEDEPSVYYMGVHHAREPISLEVVMAILLHTLGNYGINDTITNNVNNSQIWFIPLVNPNGHRIVTEQIDLWWRKNIRDNNENGQFDNYNGHGPDGVDPNRNYGFEWGLVGASDDWNSAVYHGPEPWSEPEIMAMRNLLESHQFVTGISYHSYSELVLFPYGYQYGAIAPDHYALEELATDMAITIPAEGGGHYTPQQSLQLYPCMGTTDDYSYGVQGTFAFTIELGTQFIPPADEIDDICNGNIEAAMILLDRVNWQTLTGHISDAATGNPIVAEIFIDGIDNTGSFRYPYQSDEQFGHYYRLLQTGSYNVSFSAYGYISQTINVAVTSDDITLVDVAMTPAQSFTVTGTVTDGDSGEPIEHATVEILNTPVFPDTTDSSGQYALVDVYDGTYIFRVSKIGYAVLTEEVTVSYGNNIINFELYESDIEDFETGDFSRYPWEFAGYIIQWPNVNPIEDFTIIDTIDVSWSITTDDAYEGVYSAKSGDITHNQASFMSVTADVLVDGDIEFYYRVACEYSSSGNYFYDGLIFYIDDVEMGRYQPTPSGGTPWTYVSYPVSSGSRTFSWAYVKDGSDGSTGMAEDCAWLDYIIFPPSEMIAEDVSLTMTPLNPPVEIPAGGGSFSFDVSMVNNRDMDLSFNAAIMVELPNGSSYGPVLGPVTVNMVANGTIDVTLSQWVPGAAPSGDYTYTGYLFYSSTDIIDSDGFGFTKLGTIQGAGIAEEWRGYYADAGVAVGENDMWTVDGIYREDGTLITGSMAADERSLPVSFALYQNYPNPFNPVTTIKYELPNDLYITINIFNIRGEKVTELVSGVQTAGYHQVIWNGKNLSGKSVSSGIYIYSLSAGEFHSVKKMLLFK